MKRRLPIRRLSSSRWWSWAVFTTTIGLWMTSPLHGLPTTLVSILPITALTATGILTGDDIRRLPWDILLLITGGLALGVAMDKTGLAAWAVAQLPIDGWAPVLMVIGFGYANHHHVESDEQHRHGEPCAAHRDCRPRSNAECGRPLCGANRPGSFGGHVPTDFDAPQRNHLWKRPPQHERPHRRRPVDRADRAPFSRSMGVVGGKLAIKGFGKIFFAIFYYAEGVA